MVYKYKSWAGRPAETAISPAQVALPPTDGKGIQAADNDEAEEENEAERAGYTVDRSAFSNTKIGSPFNIPTTFRKTK